MLVKVSNSNELTSIEMAQECPLLNLPRELREIIWQKVFTGEVLHVSRDNSESSKFIYHICDSPQPWSSSACPLGTADHKTCYTATSKSLDMSLLQVCKQITADISSLHARTSFFSRNAFQFSDVSTAAVYIFNLDEEDRAAITDLRLALPHPYDIVEAEKKAFQYLMNYFAFRFRREELRVPDESQVREENRWPWAKAEVTFQYFMLSSFRSHMHRMWKIWWVNFEFEKAFLRQDGVISDLKEKTRPKISLAKELHGSYLPPI